MKSVSSSFNPIKVLFLRPYSNIYIWQWIGLSILSRFYFYAKDKTGSSKALSGFQSYQGSIFTGVISLPSRMNFDFQSYQGSIFTENNGKAKKIDIELSILSRFYFYKTTASTYTFSNLLSILSRFYFYLIICVEVVDVSPLFQSYQGSIFTLLKALSNERKNTFQSYQGSIFTAKAELSMILDTLSFNPIKVLFLQNLLLPFNHFCKLSILSRFYFYWP